MPECRMAVVEEIYQNYEIGEMLSHKKAQKIRSKGAEILLTMMVGIMKIRNKKGPSFSGKENEIFSKFFTQSMALFHEDRWVIRKLCAEKLEALGLEFSQPEIDLVLSKEVCELMEDEDIIVKTQALVSLFGLVYVKDAPVFDPAIMAKAVVKIIGQIMDKVSDDEDS